MSTQNGRFWHFLDSSFTKIDFTKNLSGRKIMKTFNTPSSFIKICKFESIFFFGVGYTEKVWKSSDKISALWRYLFSTLQLLSVRLLDMCGQVEFQNCSLICLQFWRSNTKKMDLFVYLANISRKKPNKTLILH